MDKAGGQASKAYHWIGQSNVLQHAYKFGWPSEGVVRSRLVRFNKTWSKWKVELKCAFPTTARIQRLHREMDDRIYRQGEPIESYYYKLAKTPQQGNVH